MAQRAMHRQPWTRLSSSRPLVLWWCVAAAALRLNSAAPRHGCSWPIFTRECPSSAGAGTGPVGLCRAAVPHGPGSACCAIAEARRDSSLGLHAMDMLMARTASPAPALQHLHPSAATAAAPRSRPAVAVSVCGCQGAAVGPAGKKRPRPCRAVPGRAEGGLCPARHPPELLLSQPSPGPHEPLLGLRCARAVG